MVEATSNVAAIVECIGPCFGMFSPMAMFLLKATRANSLVIFRNYELLEHGEEQRIERG
jgi:hypothetical protein